jgi:hypothetical protein
LETLKAFANGKVLLSPTLSALGKLDTSFSLGRCPRLKLANTFGVTVHPAETWSKKSKPLGE